MKRILSLLLAAALLPAQQLQQRTTEDAPPLFTAEANLVIVTVFVRGSDGKPLADLAKDDFRLFENGVPQKIAVFEYQQLSHEPLPPASITLSEETVGPSTSVASVPQQPASSPTRYRDRRLLVLYFDMASMSAADQYRAVKAAEKFILTQMTASDTVAIMSYTTRLNVDQDFTSDRVQLLAALQRFRVGEASDRAAAAQSSSDSDTTADFSEYLTDDTEFNIFNTDTKLSALESAAARLAALPEKKALIYFSSGVDRSTGMENHSQLMATINTAVRANVSFYPVDVRGLDATPPGGDASAASGTGVGLFSGRTQAGQREQRQSQQDTLAALAADTGGRALFEVNELTEGIRQAQRDLESYYILGYYSSNPERDGKFRRVEVKLADNLNARLDFRRGYFAPKEFKAFNATERERQLEEALLSGNPVTEMPLALEVNYFRLGNNRYFVPLALKIPGSVVPVRKKGSVETTVMDFIGEIRDQRNLQVATLRDSITIRLREETTGPLVHRSLVYDTGFVLGAGVFKVKMLARENLSGKMGAFEGTFEIPAGSPNSPILATSTVVLGSQRDPIQESVGAADKRLLRGQQRHPLVIENRKLIPSVTKAFRQDQTLYAYLEAYDPKPHPTTRKPVVAACLQFYRDGKLVYESQPVTVDSPRGDRKSAVPISVELPLGQLVPGPYILQVTVIDEVGERFAARRSQIYVLPPGAPAGTPAAGTPAGRL